MSNRIIKAGLIISGAAVVVSAAMLFFAAGGGYLFRSEPVRHRPQPVLEKRALSERQRLDPGHCRQSLGDDAALEAYDSIAESIQSGESEPMWFGTNVNNDAFYQALFAYLSDHPEVFWVGTGNSYSYTEYDDSVCYELNYTDSGDALQSKKELLEEAVERITSQAPDNASDYDAELYLNDCLTRICTYDTEGGDRHSAYGALVTGSAVCDGYSRAFQLLCLELGIDCTVVEGTSDFNQNSDEGHMWNCVCLGGNWYHTDVTWNDAENADCEVEHYFYLNLTEEQISRNHTISGGYYDRNGDDDYFNTFVPECVSDELNWIRLNLVAINDLSDDSEIIAAMIEAARGKSSYCAYVVAGDDYKAITDEIIQRRGAEWIDAANHYTGGDPKISPDCRLASYDDKHIIAILLEYEQVQ